MTQTDFSALLPEIVLSAFAMAALLFAVYTGKDKVAPLLVWVTAALFVALAAVIGFGGEDARAVFGGMFIDDAFARFAKVTILLSAAAVLVISQDYMQRRGLYALNTPSSSYWPSSV